jgi:hypothetical protein
MLVVLCRNLNGKYDSLEVRLHSIINVKLSANYYEAASRI